MRRAGQVVLGGTFDHLHVGHEALLETAFLVGRNVAIGLTTDTFLATHPKPDRVRLEPYPTRRRHLVAWLRRRHPDRRWRVVPIDDAFGGSVLPGVDGLVVSADTVRGGRAVNAERRRRGLAAVPLVVVPLALGDDLQPIASRRIRAGVIDRAGRRRSPLRVALTVGDPRDRSAAAAAVRRVFPRPRLVRTSTASRKGAGERSSPSYDLAVNVRRRPGGWRVGVRSPTLRLRARSVPGTQPRDLTEGLRQVLHPAGAAAAPEPF